MVTTIETFFLTVMFGAGRVIMAIIGLVDMVIGIICTAAGVDPQKDAMVYKWACGGITGAITNVFKMFLYGGALITDLYDEKRLATGDFRYWTMREDSKFAQGDVVWYSIVVTDAIRLADIPSDNLYALSAPGYWSADNLTKSAFTYTWTSEEELAA
jgi:hypothetical protein